MGAEETLGATHSRELAVKVWVSLDPILVMVVGVRVACVLVVLSRSGLGQKHFISVRRRSKWKTGSPLGERTGHGAAARRAKRRSCKPYRWQMACHSAAPER